eukprot:TRINITY_DN9450_c0_g1_i2.p2 TRINITY_DN9450_c0_g1~~TRINITY_DN9450_c0_g1_i2.p2  ORF type:complete len:156 (+),score=8.74 TRINITY_DN9450_c0_g1_i2:597-1064(+)
MFHKGRIAEMERAAETAKSKPLPCCKRWCSLPFPGHPLIETPFLLQLAALPVPCEVRALGQLRNVGSAVCVVEDTQNRTRPTLLSLLRLVARLACAPMLLSTALCSTQPCPITMTVWCLIWSLWAELHRAMRWWQGNPDAFCCHSSSIRWSCLPY